MWSECRLRFRDVAWCFQGHRNCHDDGSLWVCWVNGREHGDAPSGSLSREDLSQHWGCYQQRVFSSQFLPGLPELWRAASARTPPFPGAQTQWLIVEDRQIMAWSSAPGGIALKTTRITECPMGSAEAIVMVGSRGLRPMVSSKEAKFLRKNPTISFKGSFSKIRFRQGRLSVDGASVRGEKKLRTSCLG